MQDWVGKAVIIRAGGAGNHYGYVVSVDGDTVTLERSRRLWSWWAKENGSLSAVATHGIDRERSNIGDPVTITIFGALEIIGCTLEAVESIEGGTWRDRK